MKSFPIKLEPKEKAAFMECAKIAGTPLSIWIRERLRYAAIKELQEVGQSVPFFTEIKWDE